MSGPGQTTRVLVIGSSGSGKSTLVARELVPAMLERVPRLLIINDSPELSELARAHLTIVDDSPAYDWRRLLLEQERVHVEVLATDPRDVLDELGRAALDVGDVVVVIDEAHEFVSNHRTPPGLARLYKQGRKRGVHLIAVTQSVITSSAGGISPDAVRQSTQLVVFQQTELREVERIRDEFPQLGDRVRELRPPSDGAPPDYAALDRRTGSSLIHGRSGTEWLSDRAVAGSPAGAPA